MATVFTEDIRSVTELKRHTREVLDQAHRTGRPVILTVNGKADAVLMTAQAFEQHLQIANLARMLADAERDIAAKRTRPMAAFLQDFKHAKKIQG